MTSASAPCPACKVGTIIFSEWTENGAPHGAGYWPMPMSDIESTCECELTDEQCQEAEHQAWEYLAPSLAEQDAAYAEEVLADMKYQDSL